MRLADYIASFLADRGVRQLFMVTGGGAMHLNDAFGKERRIHYVCCHHEQACAMAADSYARLSGVPAAVNVTSGPGGINALNGVFGAYTDSVPMVVVSGQVKSETCMGFFDLPKLRQLGDQEADIISMVQGMTKYAVLIRDAASIRYHLEKAWHLATTGRPGPVWLDVPIDLQGAQIEPAELEGYQPEPSSWLTGPELMPAVRQIAARLTAATRPVILVGGGIRAGGARGELLQLLARWNVPVVTAWNAHDVIADDHPNYAGRPGTLGDRPGNFAVQNADTLLILGSRLNIRQIGFNWLAFARGAYKMWVEIDQAELAKPTVHADLPVHADLKEVLATLLTLPAPADQPERQSWLTQCREWRRRYPVVLPAYREPTGRGLNPYVFIETLFSKLAADEIVVCADGSACVVAFQAATLQLGQRLYTNSGSASMGYDLPAAVGAACAAGRRVICLAGEGSLQMNLQELQTIRTHRLAVKLFVLNNGGYHSIRQTQQNFFGELHGCTPSSGVEFPDLEKLARVYDFPFTRLTEGADWAATIEQVLAAPGAAICEIMLDPAQPFAPKQSSRRLEDGRMVSAPLEDLAPFLDRAELQRNMFIPLLP